MADSSTSSLTSTSHTLTANTPGFAMSSVPSISDIQAALAFRDTLKNSRRQTFLKPPPTLPTATTEFAQVALGLFASRISDEQQELVRLRHAAAAAQKKRKRLSAAAAAAAAAGGSDEEEANNLPPAAPLLKIRKVHVDGFEMPQIWEQSTRVVEAGLLQSQSVLERLEKESDSDSSRDDDEEAELDGEEMEFDMEDGEEVDDEDLEEDEEGEEEEEEDDDDDEEDEEEQEDGDEDDKDSISRPGAVYVEDNDGLNDGFFNLQEFNKTAQYFEEQDANANPNTDVASEDEELDWHADPFSIPAKPKKKKNKKKSQFDSDSSDEEEDHVRNPRKAFGKEDDVGDEDEEDEEGPLFGDMDLDAPSGASDNEDYDGEDGKAAGGLASGLEMDLTANDIYYKDFFAPPPRKGVKGDDRGGRGGAAGGPPASVRPDMRDVERAMADVRRDLFEQISEASGSDDEGALSDVSASNPRSRRSAHERRQAKILAEIRRLEAEAIKEKNWTMSGEAAGSARPLNSLLEEQLDFEHIGKPVPVITQEVTEDIEELVKRRILAQEFDEVRRRYGTAGDADDEDARRRRRGLDQQLNDERSKKGLAEVYEEEFQEMANPDTYVSASDQKLQAEEAEVERMWKQVSSQLDALSSWHYKPRPAAPAVTVVSDVATIAMEDAQPATAQGVSGGASMLAPQEVYKPGAAGELGGAGVADGGAGDKNIVVVAKTGLPLARDEMSREDRKRHRRRNKERGSKSDSNHNNSSKAGTALAGDSTGNGGGKMTASQKNRDTMDTLKKAGVKVIGRRGEIQDLEGNKPKAAATLSSGNFKL